MMKPIWLSDEHASMRLRLVEKMASSAPRNMVITPRRKIRSPKAAQPRIR